LTSPERCNHLSPAGSKGQWSRKENVILPLGGAVGLPALDIPQESQMNFEEKRCHIIIQVLTWVSLTQTLGSTSRIYMLFQSPEFPEHPS
jgi:hypothetical protein